MKMEAKLAGLNGVLDLLKSLPPEVVSKRGGPVKSAMRKGALVILRQAKANLQAAVSNATASGKRESTGLLLANLVAARGTPPQGLKGERYQVRVRRKGYQRKGQAVSTRKTGSLLEYGSALQPAEPWLRPAFESRAAEAIATVERELVSGLARIVKKLSKGRR